jgi:transcriptional regulator with XRE-family HTH domain
LSKTTKPTKRAAHRPSEYEKAGGDEKVPAIVHQLTLLGATEEEIAVAFGVSRRTITTWEQKHEKFKQAILEGRLIADAQVGQRLFQRATGYSHPEDKIFCPKGSQTIDDVIVVPTTKHYPPDTTAAIFWLKNRRPGEWRDKQDIEHTGKDGGPIEQKTTLDLSKLTDEQLEAYRIIASANRSD